MKYYILFFLFIGFAFFAKAQSQIQPRYNYQQKRFLDSLRSAHKQPTVVIIPGPQLVHNTPVMPLLNEGEKVGMSGQDTIYRMTTDNMLLLKPDQNTTGIPNAAEGRVFMVPPAKKRP